MHSSLEAEFRSHFLLRRHVALVVYLLSKNIKRSLSVRPSPREALAWLISAQRRFAVCAALPAGRSVSTMLTSDDGDVRAYVVAMLGWLCCAGGPRAAKMRSSMKAFGRAQSIQNRNRICGEVGN
jgi:hypothetical protein